MLVVSLQQYVDLVSCKEVQLWQSVMFVEKLLISEIMSAILIEDPTECGSLM